MFPDLYRLTGGGPEDRPPPRPRGGGSPSGFPFGRRVLITEDNWLIAAEWEAALQDAGYEVTGIAVSGREAREQAERDLPDFVLMDIRLLGQEDGVEVAVALRARFGIGSIFVSAHDDAHSRERGRAAEPLGWIPKPIVAARLPQLIVDAAARRS